MGHVTRSLRKVVIAVLVAHVSAGTCLSQTETDRVDSNEYRAPRFLFAATPGAGSSGLTSR